MRTKDWLKNNSWSSKLWWLIIGAIITLLCEKACNKIVPDNPIIVKEITDSVRIIHTYDFNIEVDSIVNTQLKMKLENIALAQSYELKIDEMMKSQYQGYFNKVMLNSQFPNAKGYIIESGMPFFDAFIPSLQNEFLDFKINFFNTDIRKNIYCISVKIDEVKNNKMVMVLDENYNVMCPNNNIRIKNSLSKGIYICRVYS